MLILTYLKVIQVVSHSCRWSRKNCGLWSANLSDAAVTLPREFSTSHADVEPTQITASESEAIELQNDSPFDDELRHVAVSGMLWVGVEVATTGYGMQQQNMITVAPQAPFSSLPSHRTNLKLPPFKFSKHITRGTNKQNAKLGQRES